MLVTQMWVFFFFMWRDSIIHSSQHQNRGVWMSVVAADERVHLNTNALYISNYSRSTDKINVSSYWSKHTESRRADWNNFRQAWRDIYPFFQLYIVYNERIWTVTLVCLYWELSVMGAVHIEVYELMELCDMWHVRLFSNPIGDQREMLDQLQKSTISYGVISLSN